MALGLQVIDMNMESNKTPVLCREKNCYPYVIYITPITRVNLLLFLSSYV